MFNTIKRRVSSVRSTSSTRYIYLMLASLTIIIIIISVSTFDFVTSNTEQSSEYNSDHQHPQQEKKSERQSSEHTQTTFDDQQYTRQTKPNIVFILADDYGWKDIGYHGSEIRTPFLDKLAAQGVKLDNYYVQASCSPTRASLMTGRYQSHTGIDRVLHPAESACLPLYFHTLPEALQEHGYTTHLVGKWHLGLSRWECLPNKRGFNTFLGYHGGSQHYFNHSKNITAESLNMKMSGFDFWEDEKVTTNYEGIYSTHIYARRTHEIIQQHAKNRKPMFLLLSLQAVHEPLEVPDHYTTPYKTLIADKTRRLLAGVTSCMDEAVKNVTRALHKYGLTNDTVIIFSSDNGGAKAIHSDNRPLRGHKGLYLEGGIRVVGFVNSPLLSPQVRGTEYRGLIGAADWFPTIVEGIAGGTTHIKMDGHNIWEGIRSGVPSPREEYLHSVGGNCDWTLSSPDEERWMYGTIRKGPWKLLLGKVWQAEDTIPAAFVKHSWAEEGITINNEKYLFNLEKDPYEKTNLFHQRPNITKQLITRLREHCRSSAASVKRHEMREADPKIFGGIYTPWL